MLAISKFADEDQILAELRSNLPDADMRSRISDRAADLVTGIRKGSKPTLMEAFLAEYGLGTPEGVALMTLAEALLRVPDASTADALIADKIGQGNWRAHAGRGTGLVRAATRALMLAKGTVGTPVAAITRRGAVQAMKEMGRQFVLGETINRALIRAKRREADGFTYSYDMLGEAAMTADDAARYARAYDEAITAIATRGTGSVETSPGISIKLSALHPRYEVAQNARVMAELVPVVTALARQAAAAGIGLNIDAEEQDRLELSLQVIEAVLADPSLAGWDGFGVVVQAYGKRAGSVIDWLHALATRLDRRIMVRLVKGAYWDTEIKRAQVEGHSDFPLFTSKAATDVSYISLTGKLFSYSDRIYPQFATHNAHTVAAVLEMAQDRPFEFQRLHGMGERLHDLVMAETRGRCRIYAPVGAHRDLLAYLVRRLLENGANSSFVHQIVDEGVTPQMIARDPATVELRVPRGLTAPKDIFGDRVNSTGFDLTDLTVLRRIEAARDVTVPDAGPLTVTKGQGVTLSVRNPATQEIVANVIEADAGTVAQAIADAAPWNASATERAAILRRAADLYEETSGPIFAALSREAGKTLSDAVGELREAVDFLRYYAGQCMGEPLGVVSAISPWNFPLAIFTGQVAAALAAGNGVLAKPAEQTPLVAAIAVRLLHLAGVPRHALQLLPGQGATVGAALTSDPRISGVVFTGSTDTARAIRTAMADHLHPAAPLIAETGGLNAMIVDSTALPEQAVRDVVMAAFRSAGQRCSALRCLYVQEDIAPHVIGMIRGAMDELTVGDPWHLATDVGPVIDLQAKADIDAYLATADVIHRLATPVNGSFIAPALVRVNGIADVTREVFGPVLHVATFRAQDLDRVVDAINGTGYGLTFGLHTRIEKRIGTIAGAIHAGNAYVNRNQIGAVVGSQPFGGEGLSGTGPKAGGPLYVARLTKPDAQDAGTWDDRADIQALRHALMSQFPAGLADRRAMPGPTGEANWWSVRPRGPILCLGPGNDTATRQAAQVRALGGIAVVAQGEVPVSELVNLPNLSGVIFWGDGRAIARSLAQREGPIVPLIGGMPDAAHVLHERHLCIDVTAAGGNAALLAG